MPHHGTNPRAGHTTACSSRPHHGRSRVTILQAASWSLDHRRLNPRGNARRSSPRPSIDLAVNTIVADTQRLARDHADGNPFAQPPHHITSVFDRLTPHRLHSQGQPRTTLST